MRSKIWILVLSISILALFGTHSLVAAITASSQAAGLLSAAITNSAVSVTLVGNSAAFPQTTQFQAVLYNTTTGIAGGELVNATYSGSGHIFDLDNRGIGGTTALAWPDITTTFAVDTDVTTEWTALEPFYTRAQVDALLAYNGASLSMSATQSVTTSSITNAIWDVEQEDTNGFHDVVSNNTRITIPSGISRVILSGCVRWAADTTGERFVYILKNGSEFIGMSYMRDDAENGGSPQCTGPTAPVVVTAGDYFQMQVYQTSGGPLNLDASGNCWFAIRAVK